MGLFSRTTLSHPLIQCQPTPDLRGMHAHCIYLLSTFYLVSIEHACMLGLCSVNLVFVCRQVLPAGAEDENPFMLFLRSMLPTFSTQPQPVVRVCSNVQYRNTFAQFSL